jgi:hypothetical protein
MNDPENAYNHAVVEKYVLRNCEGIGRKQNHTALQTFFHLRIQKKDLAQPHFKYQLNISEE